MFTGYLRFLCLGKNPYTLARGDEDYSSGITSSRSIYFGYSTETRVYVSGCGKYNDSYLSQLHVLVSTVTRGTGYNGS